jgi:hypothetical protein
MGRMRCTGPDGPVEPHMRQDMVSAGKNRPFIVILGLDPRITARTLRVDLIPLPRRE